MRDPRRFRRGSVVDLFSGVGGLSHGFYLENFRIAAGIDIDEQCRYAFEKNNKAPFLNLDVAKIVGQQINDLFVPGQPKILVGCAPCQPFSTYNQKNDDPKWELLFNFSNLISETLPDVVSMENVPRLMEFRGGAVFRAFEENLRSNGYSVSAHPVFVPGYGVPQHRTRLVVLASRLGPIELESPHLAPDEYKTVRQAISEMPELKAGEADSKDPLHKSSVLSELNLRRIHASRPGGTWRDWDKELVAACHREKTGKGYGAVYGRMEWDSPAPTITTQFFGFGSGRFGHPEQHRAISLREGAILQSFPADYEFIEPGTPVQIKTVGRLIGNAVPVLLARAIARSIAKHLEEYQG